MPHPDRNVRAQVRVLHRDAHLLVLDKPSGLPTTSPEPITTLVSLAQQLDPDAPRLHASSRLDAEVSGIVTFARTPEATEHLLRARKEQRYRRGYLGIAARAPEPAQGEWHGAIGLDPRDARKRRVVDDAAPGARTAWSRYRVLAAREGCVLLWLEPQTGRTHQLRVHASAAGAPLFGDRPYGGALRCVLPDGSVITARRTLLHCCRVQIPALDGDGELRFESPPAEDLARFWQDATGAPIPVP